MKKIYTIIYIILILFLITIFGCRKEKCPGFPTGLNFFPYSKGQELKFINSLNEIKSFIIEEKYSSLPYELCNGLYGKCACEPPKSGFFTYQNQDSIQIQCSLEIWDNNVLEASSQFRYSYLYSDYFFKEFSNATTFLSEIDTITIEGNNSKICKKVVIVKEKGLVSYTTADGEEWKLVE